MFFWRVLEIAGSELIAGFVPHILFPSQTLRTNVRTKKLLAFSPWVLTLLLVLGVADLWAQTEPNFPDSKAVGTDNPSPTSAESILDSGVAASSNPNTFANIRVVTPSWNWQQTPSSDIHTSGMNTITLSPCPSGIDTVQGAYVRSKGAMSSGSNILTTSNNSFDPVWMGFHVQVRGAGPAGSALDGIITGFKSSKQVMISTRAATTVTDGQVYIASYRYTVRISGAGTAETVPVAGGTCTPGASNGTISVLTAYPHSAGYTVGSSSSGIQEAWNDAWTSDTAVGVSGQTAPYVKLMSNQQYQVYGSVYLRGRGGIFDGAGAYVVCSTRDRCIYVGVTRGGAFVDYHKVYNLSGGSAISVDGAQISSVSAISGVYTVTTAAAHPFVVGDIVDCEMNSQNIAAHLVVSVLSIPTSNSFTFQKNRGSDTVAADHNTFGWCALLNAFIEDNSDHVALQDVNIFQSVNPLAMGQFTYGIVNDNDQQFIIERAANRGKGVILASENFPVGAFVYQRTDQGTAGITYLHNSEFSNINCATAGGNGFVLSDTVCQGFPVFGVRYFAGLQEGTFSNIYQESTGASPNPMYGYAAQAGYVLTGVNHFYGSFPANGWTPTFQSAAGGTAATVRNYFLVVKSSAGTSSLFFIGQSNPSNSGGVNITVKWPSTRLLGVSNVTFDLLATLGTKAPPYGTGDFAVQTRITWDRVCNSGGMCTFVDTQAALSSYTVAADPTWAPTFWFWPANLALNNPSVYIPTVWGNPAIVSNYGTKVVSVVAERCGSAGNPAQFSPIWIQCSASDPMNGTGRTAMILQQQDQAGNGPAINTKGRINLGKAIAAPTDVVTLADSNFAKTTSTTGGRPSNDQSDTAIGFDQFNGLFQRAPASISNYINVLPNGSNYQERLTAAAKTFNVPVTINGNLSMTSGSLTLPFKGRDSQCLQVNSKGVVSGTGADCGHSPETGRGDLPSGNAAVPNIWVTSPEAGSGGLAMPAAVNKMMLWGVINPLAITTTTVAYSVGRTDTTSNIYDLGIYSAEGHLLLHTGPIPGTKFASTVGTHTLNWLASQTLMPGRYYIAFTSSCTSSCASLLSAHADAVVFHKAEASSAITIITGGVCPPTIDRPNDKPAWDSSLPALILQ